MTSPTIADRVRALDAAEPGLSRGAVAERLGCSAKAVDAARRRGAGGPGRPRVVGAERRITLPRSVDRRLLDLAQRLGRRPEDVVIDLVRSGLDLAES